MKLLHLILLFNLLIASVVVSLPIGNNSTFASRIHLNGRQRFTDEFGRERFFHGVNAVYKNSPYIPIIDHFDVNLSLSQEDIDILTNLGLNVVRLGTMWPGAEPSSGQFNETYFDIIQTILDRMAKSDMYALLDVHQDCFSEFFCVDGVPTWAIEVDPFTPAFPLPFLEPFVIDNSTGLPTNEDCSKLGWSTWQFTAAAANAYQNLYNVGTRSNVAFSRFWSKIAERFSNTTNVIGYELFNEPFAGDYFAKPELMLPGVADKQNLQPFYDNLNTVIRAQDPDGLIFFESTTWDDDVPIGFEHAPGGDTFANRSVISFHYYFPPNISPENQMGSRTKDAGRLQTGLFLTEFDIGDDQDDEKVLEKMIHTMDVTDAYTVSWMGWDYKTYAPGTAFSPSIFFANGTYNMPVLRALSRSYPQAVAGSTLSYLFDSNTAQFEVRYTIDATITQPTDIFICEDVHYPKGYTVGIVPAGLVSWTSSKNHIFVTPVSSSSHGRNVTVIINAK